MIYTVLAIGIVFGALGAFIAERKGRSHTEGFILGFLFGLIGVLIELILSPKDSD